MGMDSPLTGAPSMISYLEKKHYQNKNLEQGHISPKFHVAYFFMRRKYTKGTSLQNNLQNKQSF